MEWSRISFPAFLPRFFPIAALARVPGFPVFLRRFLFLQPRVALGGFLQVTVTCRVAVTPGRLRRRLFLRNLRQFLLRQKTPPRSALAPLRVVVSGLVQVRFPGLDEPVFRLRLGSRRSSPQNPVVLLRVYIHRLFFHLSWKHHPGGGQRAAASRAGAGAVDQPRNDRPHAHAYPARAHQTQPLGLTHDLQRPVVHSQRWRPRVRHHRPAVRGVRVPVRGVRAQVFLILLCRPVQRRFRGRGVVRHDRALRLLHGVCLVCVPTALRKKFTRRTRHTWRPAHTSRVAFSSRCFCNEPMPVSTRPQPAP
mmetsp:Transcript_1732/g.6526  ORF Transcript_1732/g.6526 Transcript_1732/m.6526 type:complete len:307 (-) Transcript_1732:130-1050(-)